MADDAERAAKAARAKAMLNKRRQQQKGTAASPPPAPRIPEPQQDAAVLFGDASGPNVDFGEFGVLQSPKKGAQDLVSQSPTATVHNGAEVPDVLRTLVDNQQQTISLLVSEKALLTARLDHFQELESKYAENEARLDEERRHAETFRNRAREFEEHAKAVSLRFEEATRHERDANDKAREQDRELELARRTCGELKSQLESRTLELHELKEQVESDDRVETLERSLQGTQDRAEELAMNLSKVKQALSAAAQERDKLAEELKGAAKREAEWEERHSALHTENTTLMHEHSQRGVALETTERTLAELQQRLATHDTALADARQERAHAIAELSSQKHALHAAQESAASTGRLQAENAGLLAQLEEIRPRVVELSNKGAEYEELLWDAQRRARALEGTVTAYEAQLEERRVEVAEWRDRMSQLERERGAEVSRLTGDLREVQDAYTKVADELKQAQERVEALGKETHTRRATQHAHERDANRWKLQTEELQTETEALHNELDERRQAADDALALVNRTQSEIESLRDQLALREDEIARLREASSDSQPSSPPHHDLSIEMLSAARQQHALDLSTAHSRIRSLETELFEAQARTHAAQKRAAALTEEVTQLRAQNSSPDSRRTSFSAARPRTPLITARPVYEGNLSATTRHKREVSLGMLRARIERERTAASPLSRTLSSATVSETPAERGVPASMDRPSPSHVHSFGEKGPKHPPQFLDESHVFWCHSCRGDLVVL